MISRTVDNVHSKYMVTNPKSDDTMDQNTHRSKHLDSERRRKALEAALRGALSEPIDEQWIECHRNYDTKHSAQAVPEHRRPGPIIEALNG